MRKWNLNYEVFFAGGMLRTVNVAAGKFRSLLFRVAADI
jgi:hypothetical protein